MVLPILLSASFISTTVFVVLYLKGEGKRKDLEAKFKTTRDYAETLTKSVSKLELQLKERQSKIEFLAGQLMSNVKANTNGVEKAPKAADAPKPRKRGPRRKNNNNNETK
jgi:hypothetical protein